VKAFQIGQLIQVRGIVTRVSDVRPKLVVATYTCDECGHEMYVTVPGQTYMPKVDCESAQCQQSKGSGRLFLQTRGSKFVKQQEIKIQEMPDQV
jgi:DNA replication licensing factor MCM7